MMLALLALCSSAFGAMVMGTVGAEIETRDPYSNHMGIHLGSEYWPTPWVSFGVAAAFYPVSSWTPLTEQLVYNNHVAPHLSPMKMRIQPTVRIAPLHIEAGGIPIATGVHASMGGVRTSDDLEALQQEGDQYAVETAEEWHLSSVLGLNSTLGGGTLRGRVRIERGFYIETVSSINVEVKRPVFWGFDLVLVL